MCVSMSPLPKVLLFCTLRPGLQFCTLTRDVRGTSPERSHCLCSPITTTKHRHYFQGAESQRIKESSATSQTPSEKFPWAERLQWDKPGSEPCYQRSCLLLERTREHNTVHLSTTAPIIYFQLPHWQVAHLIPLLLWLLEVKRDHLRSGRSTACQSCCDPAWEETNHEHFRHREGGKFAHHGVNTRTSPTMHTWGKVPHCPECSDPTLPELKILPRDKGTWKNFILPICRSGEFFLFVRTTGRIIIPIIIKAVIGVLCVVKHRPAPCSAPVEWERWSDVSQS